MKHRVRGDLGKDLLGSHDCTLIILHSEMHHFPCQPQKHCRSYQRHCRARQPSVSAAEHEGAKRLRSCFHNTPREI